MAKQGKIRVGVGGWTFEPWRGVFYPKGLSHAQELNYASQHLTSIEINGTFYRTQMPATFAKWRSETPEGFVFSVKGVRYAVNRRVLAEAGDSIKRFLDSGVTELGSRLGRILWQFAATKKFDEADFGKFLELLPAKLGSTPLRHVVEPRHASFLHAGVHRAAAPVLDSRRLRRARHLSGHPRSGRRLRLRAPAEGQGRHQDRLSAEGPRRSGPSARRPGPRAARQRISRWSSRQRRPRRSLATCSSISSTRARCARLPPPWR